MEGGKKCIGKGMTKLGPGAQSVDIHLEITGKQCDFTNRTNKVDRKNETKEFRELTEAIG